jgi:hypothetical protein
MIVHFKWFYSVTCGTTKRCDMGYHFNLEKKHLFTYIPKFKKYDLFTYLGRQISKKVER